PGFVGGGVWEGPVTVTPGLSGEKDRALINIDLNGGIAGLRTRSAAAVDVFSLAGTIGSDGSVTLTQNGVGTSLSATSGKLLLGQNGHLTGTITMNNASTMALDLTRFSVDLAGASAAGLRAGTRTRLTA